MFLGGVFHVEDVGDTVYVEPYESVSRKCDIVCDMDNSSISTDIFHIFRPLDVLQEAWIS